MTQKTTKIPRLPLTDDYIFKRVFAFEGNESVLKDLLEAILRKDIKTVTIKNPEIIPYEKDDKRGLLDIKAETDDGTVLDIEMQMEDKKNAEERGTVYGRTNDNRSITSWRRLQRIKKEHSNIYN